MTSRTTLSIELRDIRAVEFECAACHMKVSYPLDKYARPLSMCNACQPPKQFLMENSQEAKDLITLGEVIRRLSQMAVGLTVRLEISN
jgi:hypothetical protein